MKLRDVWTLFRRETRAALREQTIVLEAVLGPVLLFPLLMWLMFTAISFAQGQTEGFVSRTALSGFSAEHVKLLEYLEDADGVDIRDLEADMDEAREQIRAGEIDILVQVNGERVDRHGSEEGLPIVVIFDESRDRSSAARGRLTTLIEEYRDERLEREREVLGIDEAEWSGFSVEGQNVATDREMGGFILGLLLPMFFVISVAMGSYSVAVDATAGERERGTWETTMTLATSRAAVILAKYLHVTAFGFVAGIMNLVAMTLSMGRLFGALAPAEGATLQFAMPWSAVPIVVLAALALSAFVAAGMMLLASFARTYKEGQAMVTPFYLLLVLPAVFLNTPGLEFSPRLALVPVVNIALMVRQAITGSYPALEIGLTVLSSTAVIAALIAMAVVVLRFEDFVIGSYGGSLGTFVRQRLLKKGKGQ